MEESGIYMIINNTNLKVYIGSAKCFRKRKSEHFTSLKKNKHYNKYLQASFNKYGENNFSFIVLENNIETCDLFKKESDWIYQKDSLNPMKGYNLDIPQKDERLSLTPEVLQAKVIKAYHQWYGDNPKISLEEFLNGKRAKDLIEKLGPQNKKVVFGFNKVTGIKEFECESVAQVTVYLKTQESVVRRVLDKDNKTCKGFILVSQDKYDSDKEYKWISKQKTPIKKEYFKGNPVETFDLITNDTTQQFTNKHEMSEYYNVSVKYINKVFSKEKKSLKGFGVRYTSKRPYILKTENP